MSNETLYQKIVNLLKWFIGITVTLLITLISVNAKMDYDQGKDISTLEKSDETQDLKLKNLLDNSSVQIVSRGVANDVMKPIKEDLEKKIDAKADKDVTNIMLEQLTRIEERVNDLHNK